MLTTRILYICCYPRQPSYKRRPPRHLARAANPCNGNYAGIGVRVQGARSGHVRGLGPIRVSVSISRSLPLLRSPIAATCRAVRTRAQPVLCLTPFSPPPLPPLRGLVYSRARKGVGMFAGMLLQRTLQPTGSSLGVLARRPLNRCSSNYARARLNEPAFCFVPLLMVRHLDLE